MSESIVDILEAIEVEVKNCELLAGAQLSEVIFDLRAEQMPIGQIGQPIMQRHVRDFGFGPSSLSDVLVRDDPAAPEHGLIGDEYVAPIRRGDDALHDGAFRQLGKKIGAILIRIHVQQSRRGRVL